ncbi:LamB/YcsF [Auricularia subglabra TFB-10046 SS5]|nr:LamB/YcsF [Auricularia subglabra TFB-10046 SS5]
MTDAALKKIGLNADMGESFGRWILADDAGIMPHIDVANVAAGGHAGDPSTIHATVKLAKAHNVGVGAHPGFFDLVGFGRRTMALSPQEVGDLITYQVGAVAAFCQLEGVPLDHVKPHGSLYFYLLTSREICEAAVRAVAAFRVPYYGLPGTLHEAVCRDLNVPFVPEVYVDIEYDANGKLLPVAQSKTMSPGECAERVRRIAEEDTNYAQGSSDGVKMGLQGRPFSVCIHSDIKTAVENVQAVRKVIDQLNAKLYPGV